MTCAQWRSSQIKCKCKLLFGIHCKFLGSFANNILMQVAICWWNEWKFEHVWIWTYEFKLPIFYQIIYRVKIWLIHFTLSIFQQSHLFQYIEHFKLQVAFQSNYFFILNFVKKWFILYVHALNFNFHILNTLLKWNKLLGRF